MERTLRQIVSVLLAEEEYNVKRVSIWLAFAAFFALASMGIWMPSSAQQVGADRFSIALIGDLPYTPEQEYKFIQLIEEVNRSDVAFVIHDGDLKSGSTECTNELFEDRKRLFETFQKPFIYVLGDNEWTDCHRENNGAYDPLERLNYVRALFTEGDRSLAVPTIQLERQSNSPQYSTYRENVRWVYNNILFATLHIVGSNNNLGRTPENDAEYRDRNATNLAWMEQSFAKAKSENYAGLMLVIHANPLFELDPGDGKRAGFNDFISALAAEVTDYDRPVVLVHGDTHRFQINKPLTRDGAEIANFTRVETFGSPNVLWLRAIVDPTSQNVFEFKQELGLSTTQGDEI